MLYDRVKYIIVKNDSRVEVQEPKGWETAKKSWIRNKDLHGIAVNITTDIEFFNDGFESIVSAFNDDGINAFVQLEVWRRNRYTDVFELDYLGDLDYSTYVELSDSVKIKLNANDITTKYKSNKNTKIEYKSQYRIDGSFRDTDSYRYLTIPKIPTTTRANLVMESQTRQLNQLSFDALGKWRSGSMPFRLVTPDGEDNTTTGNDMATAVDDSSGLDDTPNTDGVIKSFWVNTSPINDGLEITVNVKVDITLAFTKSGHISNEVYLILLRKYDSSGNAISTLHENQIHEETNIYDGKKIRVRTSKTFKFIVNTGESYSVEHYLGANFGNIWKRGRLGIDFKSEYIQTASISESHETVQANDGIVKFALIRDVLSCVSDSALNNTFKSSLFEKGGKFDGLGLINGFLLRKFEDAKNGFVPITVSLEDLIKSINSIMPIGIDLDDSLIVEDVSYFYQDFTYTDIGKVSEIEISNSDVDYLSNVEVGFFKSAKDDEGSLLDEFNCKTEFSTTLRNSKKQLKLISKFRADTSGIDEAKKGYVAYDETDDDKSKSAKGDKDIWFVDTYTDDNWMYNMSLWDKHFTEIPNGLNYAEYMFNFRLSPRNSLERHLKVLKIPFNNVNDSKLVFASTDGIKEMNTTLIETNKTLIEGDNVEIGEVTPIHKGMTIKFKTKYQFNDINEHTNNVRNYYGLLLFNANNVSYTSHIMSIEKSEGNEVSVICVIKNIL